eukprot:TRINITY_DN5046_c0_g1_i3.p2 TRINITY_DN5046_c0_g1~~TRINITY_DN5046_c0_g1_i3.p2  ORF type:complete len:234 (+),score=36.64 TRINITY_DN5046_c0_g1_i3:258-959(+)
MMPLFEKRGIENLSRSNCSTDFELSSLDASKPASVGAALLQTEIQRFDIKECRKNPTPIGLLAFGMTSIMLVFPEFGWEKPEFVNHVQGYGLFYGGLVLFLAGWMELLVGNTFTATSFVTYGAARMTWYFARHEVIETEDFKNVILPAIVINLVLGLFTSGFFVVAILKKPLFTKVVFGSLVVMFFAIGGEFSYVFRLMAALARFVSSVAACYGALVLVVRDEADIKLPGLRV